MADGRSIKQDVPHPNSGLRQQTQVEVTNIQQHQHQTSTQSNLLSSKLSSEVPQTNTYQNHNVGDFALSQAVGLSKSSSIGDNMDDHDELFGEKILQNRHVAFPPDHIQQVATQNNAPLSTISTTQYQQQQQQQQHITSNYTQPQANNLSSEQHDGASRTLQRNHSLPIPPTLPVLTTSPPPPTHVNQQQHPPSPNHDATQRVIQLPGATLPVTIVVETTASSNGQVVTKKKGRFKFVEQLPIQRLSNDNLMNDSNIELNQQQQQQVPNSIPSSSSSTNLQAIPPPPSQSQMLPPGSQSTVQEGQPQMITTTPNVQKKGRFVVTTLPLPTTLNGGSATTATVQQHLLTQPQQQQQQQQQQNQHHPAVESTLQQSQSVVDNVHVRRASDIGTYPATSLMHTTTMPFLSNVAPPLPLPTISKTNNGQYIGNTGQHTNGQSIGYVAQHPNTNVESNAQVTSQTLSHSSININGDDSPVHVSALHYDTIQSTSSSSSRQTSPKTVPKPNVTARHNTTGAAATPTMSSTTSSFVSTSSQQQRQQNQPPGFGKMLYFLDQMKLEVTEADQSIKSLQTDMKCLKEKNKELEAKARDMERKWNQEKALREVAETRVKALKKKIRALEGAVGNNTTTNPNDTSIENGYFASNNTGVPIRDDESVGTNQTGNGVYSEKQQQQQYQPYQE